MDWRGWARAAAVGWFAAGAVFLWQAATMTGAIDVILRLIAGGVVVAYGGWLLVRRDVRSVRYLGSAASLCGVYAIASALLVPGRLEAWQAVPFGAAVLGFIAFGRGRAAGVIPDRRARPAA